MKYKGFLATDLALYVFNLNIAFWVYPKFTISVQTTPHKHLSGLEYQISFLSWKFATTKMLRQLCIANYLYSFPKLFDFVYLSYIIFGCQVIIQTKDALIRRNSYKFFWNQGENIGGICLPNLDIWLRQVATNIKVGAWILVANRVLAYYLCFQYN